VRRPNYRGRPVLFPLGVLPLAAAVAELAVATSAWLVFLGGVAALGLVDDAFGTSGPRGWRAHGNALVRGELSTGALKAAGTAMLALYAAAEAGARGPELIAEALVLALAAHLGNLLDTRPGRAEKALALTAAGVCASARSLVPLSPIAALLPAVTACSWLTLRERAMLGDSGASLVGGMAGVLVVTQLPAAVLPLAAAALAVISLYGEFRSLGAAIERVPLLARLDSLGRVS
jgi:hypothetical protein